jgi:hypothetical protein
MRFSLLALLLVVGCGSTPGQAAETSPLSGSRAEQVAQVLAAIIPVSRSRDWAAARAAFPGARWGERTSSTVPTTDGSTHATDYLDGSIDLDGDRYRIIMYGTPARVASIELDAPEGIRADVAALRRALATRGASWRLIRCDPVGEAMTHAVLELTAGGQSAIFSMLSGEGGGAYIFSFDEALPQDPPRECAEAQLRDLR